MSFPNPYESIYQLPPNPLLQLAQDYQPEPDFSQFAFHNNPLPNFQSNSPYHSSSDPFTSNTSNSPILHHSNFSFTNNSSEHPTSPTSNFNSTPAISSNDQSNPKVDPEPDSDAFLASSDSEDGRPQSMAPRKLKPTNCVGRSLVSGVGLGLPVLEHPWAYIWSKEGGGVEYRVGDKGMGTSPVRVKISTSGHGYKPEAETAHRQRHVKARSSAKAEKKVSEDKRKADNAVAKAKAKDLEEQAKELRRIAEEGEAKEVSKKRKAGVDTAGDNKDGEKAKGGKKARVESKVAEVATRASWSSDDISTLIDAALRCWDRYKSHQMHTLEELKEHLESRFSCDQILYKLNDIEATVRYIIPFLKETGSGHGNREEGAEFEYDSKYTSSRVLAVYYASWFDQLYDVIKAKPNICPVELGSSTGAVLLSKEERLLCGLEPEKSDSDSDSLRGSDKQALKLANQKRAKAASVRDSKKRSRVTKQGIKGGKRMEKRKEREQERKRRKEEKARGGGSDSDSAAELTPSEDETVTDRMARQSGELLVNVSASIKLRQTQGSQEFLRRGIREAIDFLQQRIARLEKDKDEDWVEMTAALKKKLREKEDEYDAFL